MTHPFTRRILQPAALPLAVAAALTPALVFAQDGTAADENTDELDRITVTGSRIASGVDVEGTAPVLTLNRAQLEQTGLTSVGDVLFNLTASDGGALRNITTGTNGSDGTQNISLRGLGANRTLVLVNGRRWVGDISGTGSTDLNTVPISVVERIEVLKDGASAIYGSDAIAGVINVITRTNFQGAEARVYLGEYSKGDGFQQAYDFTVGSNSDRWNAVLSLSYTEQDPVFAGDRTISSVPVYGGGDIASGGLFGSGSNLYGNFNRCAGPFTVNPINGFSNCTLVAGGSFTLNPGEDGRQSTDFRRFVGYRTDGSGSSDRYNFAPVNYLLQPIERFNIYGQGRLALTDKINANVQAVYVKRSSVQQLAEVPLTMDTRGTAGPQWAFAPTATNVFNPFGQDIRNFSFRAQAVGPRHNSFANDNIAFTGWLDGSFELGSRTMYWDAGYSYLESRFSLRGDNYINLFNLRNAVGPSFRDGGGVLRCGTPGNVIAGCVPYNLFGGPDLGLGAGVISRAEYDAMNDYISYELATTTENTTKDYFANLSGDLFDLPAGPLGFAVGFEHRTTGFLNQPDALVAGGGSSNNFSEPTSGDVSVDEYYLELNVPILAEITGFKALDLNVAARRSDYDARGVFGGGVVEPDIGGDTAKKVGLKWRVNDDLMIRGTWSESFRAPSVAELFTGIAETFPIATDPCNTVRITQGTTDVARCLSLGVPVAGAPQANPQIRSLASGNPDLKPESGDTRSFGIVYSPSWLDGLDITLDWYKLKLEDVVVFRGSQGTLDGCFTFPNSTANSAPDDATRDLLCTFIDRDPTNGQLTRVQQSSFNLGSGEVEGYDMQVVYRFPDTAWGKFGVQWDTNYQTKNNLFGAVGTYNGIPTWRLRSNVNLTWQKGDWDASWAMRYYSALDEACPFGNNYFEYGITPRELCPQEINDANGNFLRSENHIPAAVYHDMQVGWKTPWNAKVTVGARNVFGKEPPRTVNSFAHSFDGAYDLPGGGFFYLQYNQKF